MIEWKGLFANTPYSSANNKTQDDAVVGMQDTIYVTGPGYGGYSANVRIHNASGAVVALIPVSGGGGALSAPAPVRILDDSTTYSYSLEVVRGAVPSDDADKIVIRIVGGASKRYPGQGSTLADGSTAFAGSLNVAGGVVAPNVAGAHNQIRVAIDGDSIAEKLFGGGFLDIAIAASHGKFVRVANQAVGGSKAANVDARILDLAKVRPDEVWFNIGVNDKVLSSAFKASYLSILAKIQSIGARPVVFLPNYYSTDTTNRNNISAMNEWIEAVCRSKSIECNQMWDNLLLVGTGSLNPAKVDALVIHPIWSERKIAGEQYAARRIPSGGGYRRNALGLYLGKWAADPFNTTGSGTQGARWATGTATNATATYSKVPCVFPDVGNWQRVSASLSAVAGATLTWTCGPNSGFLIPEGDFEVSYRIKCTSFVNLSLSAYVWISDNSGTPIGNRIVYHNAIEGDLDGTIDMVIRVPAGAYQPQLAFTAVAVADGVAATGDIDIAMIGMKTLVP